MNNRNAKTILLLSVVVPVGLLMAFKFEGLLGETTSISGTLNLDPVKWELERPYGSLNLDSNYKAVNVFSDKEISMYLEATPRNYDEDDSWAGGADVLSHRVLANISMTSGFLRNLNIISTEKAQLVKVSFPSSYGYSGARKENLWIDSSASVTDDWWLLQGNTRAFMNMTGLNKPHSVLLDERLDCWLLGTQNQTHEMQLTFEIIYFNGTVYKRLMQPFTFIVSRDDNDSFETAQEITSGRHTRLYIGGYDSTDFYRIYVKRGQRLSVHVNATSIPTPGFLLYLYGPTQDLKAVPASENSWFYEATIAIVADATGYWFLEVRAYTSFGFYDVGMDVS